MWIRQLLVPGYTDSEEDLLQLKALIASLKTVQKVELLPYHDLGKYKWEELVKDLKNTIKKFNIPEGVSPELIEAKKLEENKPSSKKSKKGEKKK